jgi:pimeloyl-ACP methyl ester carboxylesterase
MRHQALTAKTPARVDWHCLTEGTRKRVHARLEELCRQIHGRYAHRLIPGAGHNLPQEAPQAFAAAVAEVGVLGQG